MKFKSIVLGILIAIIGTLFSAPVAHAATFSCQWSSSSNRCVVSSHTCTSVYAANFGCGVIANPTECNNLTAGTCSGGENQGQYCPGGNSLNTAVGCIPVSDQQSLFIFFLRLALGIAGGIAFLLMIIASFQIITSSGDPKKLQAGKELLTAAIGGLVLLIFSVFILRLLAGPSLLNIPFFQ